MDQNKRKEVQEAINAADRALNCLYDAKDYLGSARNWGIVDILGGGFFSTFMKRSKMRDASSCIQDAKNAIAAFRKELADVDSAMPLAIDESDFWGFADYFFDGFFVDIMVQDQIASASYQVDEAIRRVSDLRLQLSKILEQL